MPYDARAFCTTPNVPTLAELQRWFKEQGSEAFFADDLDDTGAARAPAANLDDPAWPGTSLAHRAGEQAIFIECNRDDGTESCPCRQDANDFIERIGPPGRSKKKQRVIDHLRATRFIIFCQIPFSVIDETGDPDADDGLRAAQVLFEHLVKNHGAMVYFDNEGFYDSNGLFLKD